MITIASAGPVYLGAIPQISSLHQIPSPLADFTGRQEDLSALKAGLTRSRSGAIFGMGGVGKSALAFKLAEDLTPLYPDAQIYLDLKGVDPQPLTAIQAMAHVVQAFHPDARVSESADKMTGLYRSVLHGKRTLLLMDNARDRAQVEPLIPPAGSLLLVTSRFRFTLPGLVVRDLDELPEADACALLLRIAPRIGTAAGEIAGLCGRLPLALRLAGSVLAERLDLSPADYARRLREGTLQLDRVEASLNLSYELLSEDLRRLWRLLAVFPGTFDAPAAAAVWDLGTDPASDALGDLGRSSLVEWEGKDGRYRLHDLARSFADRRLESPERNVAQRRHAEHYLEVLRATKDLYKKGGESVLLGLRMFDTEWGNLQSGQVWAATHSSTDPEAARMCSEYPLAGTFLLELRQHPRDRIRWLELALTAARQRKDRGAEGAHLGNLGIVYWYLGEPQRAIELHEQALAIDRETGDRRGEANDLGNLGLAYRALGESRRAIEFYEQWLAIAREIGDRRGEASALGNLGVAYANLGEPRRAIEFFEQQITIAREIGDRRSEGNSLGCLGVAYKNLGEPRRAIEFYEQQLTITREIGDRRGEANASWNLGLEIGKAGDLRRAADLMQVLVDYEREIGHPDAENIAAYVAALRAEQRS